MNSYGIISLQKAVDEGYPDVCEDDLTYLDDPDWTAGLWRFVDGTTVTLIATDAGEPEDYSFRRDLSWIPGALETAYQQGRSDYALELDGLAKEIMNHE